ncbi:hypothetical protein [Mycolicibacterium cosmeticum]|uniref:hypothetical protein n=1 Tax=Mycolicibacterium cosmeticum TaxID=258533 RepID=UPI003204793A
MSWLSEAIRASSNDIGDAITNTPTRQRINDLRTAYREACDSVRGDASLSELGKQQMLARAWSNTRAEIARLAQLDFDTQVTRFNDLEKQVFGTTANSGADAVSFRDATDRAEKLDSADAAIKALGTAELSGDTILAKAIVLQAWQRDWSAVVDQYAVTNPTITDKLAELGALRQHLDSTASRLGGAMGASLPRPTEIQNLSLRDIADYAAAEPALSLDAVLNARMTGTATPQQEQAARQQAAADARARAQRGE